MMNNIIAPTIGGVLIGLSSTILPMELAELVALVEFLDHLLHPLIKKTPGEPLKFWTSCWWSSSC